jgi:hypothetical protein
MKINHFSQFKVDAFSFKILPVYLTSSAASIVLLIEFIIFLAYSFSYPSKMKSIIVMALLVIFTVLLWLKKKRGGSATCGCFGQVEALNNHPFFRNFSLLGLTVMEYLLPSYHTGMFESLMTSLGIVTLIFLYDIAQLVGSNKGLIQWDQLKL